MCLKAEQGRMRQGRWTIRKIPVQNLHISASANIRNPEKERSSEVHVHFFFFRHFCSLSEDLDAFCLVRKQWLLAVDVNLK